MFSSAASLAWFNRTSIHPNPTHTMHGNVSGEYKAVFR